MHLIINDYKTKFTLYGSAKQTTDPEALHNYLLKYYRNYVLNTNMQSRVKQGLFTINNK